MNREIYSGVITLKNLAIVNRDNPLSSEILIETLMENSNRLKPYYQVLLVKIRNGNRAKAFKEFGLDIGTKQARNMAVILSKLDQINPIELLEQLEIFQNMMMEIRITEEMKSVERKSVVGTLLSTACVFSLLINFAMVVIFLDSLTMLRNLF